MARAARLLLAESGCLESPRNTELVSSQAAGGGKPVRRHLSTEMAEVSLAAEFSCFASSLWCCPLEHWSTLEHKQNLHMKIKKRK